MAKSSNKLHPFSIQQVTAEGRYATHFIVAFQGQYPGKRPMLVLSVTKNYETK